MVTLEEVQNALLEVVADLEVRNEETGDTVTVDRAETLDDAGVLTLDSGLLLRLSDGRAVVVKLAETR